MLGWLFKTSRTAFRFETTLLTVGKILANAERRLPVFAPIPGDFGHVPVPAVPWNTAPSFSTDFSFSSSGYTCLKTLSISILRFTARRCYDCDAT
jgi:hypothetical protein